MGGKVSRGIVAGLGAGFMALAVAASAQHGGADMSGTAPQASGAQAYAAHCAACHGLDLGGPGGPNPGVPLRGSAFVAKWSANPSALLDYTQKAMPLQNPGGLDSVTYANIVGYIRARNGMEAGVAAAPSSVVKPATGLESIAQTQASASPPDKTALATRARLDALAASVTPVSDETLRNPAQGDWIGWGGSQGTSGHSPLKQIDRGNVAQLEPDARHRHQRDRPAGS
jgi:alcohol dehydrogenase (cytochrome c)